MVYIFIGISMKNSASCTLSPWLQLMASACSSHLELVEIKLPEVIICYSIIKHCLWTVLVFFTTDN